MLPPADTIDGEDLPDSTINRLQQLPSFDGLVASPTRRLPERPFSPGLVLIFGSLGVPCVPVTQN